MHFTIPPGAKTPSAGWHTSISIREHLISFCNCKTLDLFKGNKQSLKKIPKLYSNRSNISRSQTPLSAVAHLDAIKTATSSSLQLANITGLCEIN